MKIDPNTEINNRTDDNFIFKRPYNLRKNLFFNIILLCFFGLDLSFIIWIQDYESSFMGKKQLQNIRTRYINALYLDPDTGTMAQSTYREEINPSESHLITKKSGPKTSEDKKTPVDQNPHYGKMKMVLLNISTDYDYLLAHIPSVNMSGAIKKDLDAMLDKVLKKINEDMNKPAFDPALDMSYFERSELHLEREEIKPTINMNRIETGLLTLQAHRNQQEVNKQLKKNEHQLSYCIHKFMRFSQTKKIMIVTTFEIDYRGFVIRNSIQIAETNIQNDQVIRCIKNIIGRWKNFGVIDDLENTYRVRQKWIF